ncbi:hypothetical protein QT13_01800 [Pectobacterium brasiliense]|uniref:hypothetical protein n=1 Tax=Pectobacterium brasiliense TaxID=180957 RepID=UPI00057C4C91|nr:hypothetical protein [Pectobacterium brasiliense]KHS77000.1 hypothetical protein QT13_01800 [Pectobacterium brasiliense]
MTKIYVTKYALTSGVFAVEAEVEDTMATFKRDVSYFTEFAHGNDFHLTHKEALADCERRRKAKISSLDKQRKKLEAMKFEIED